MLLGIPQPHISALEHGKRRVTSLEVFERFADGLGIPPAMLGLADDSQRPGTPGRHEPGGTVLYSEIIPVQQALGISAGRVAEVLQEMGVLDDDRRPSFESWLDRKLDGLVPAIRADVEGWLRTMRGGGPRSRPRDIASVWNHMNQLRPALLGWSGHYGHLREVTRDDVLAVLGDLHGSRRANVLVALRSLFAFCKKNGTIFRNPAQGIRVGQHPYGIIQPLRQDEVD